MKQTTNHKPQSFISKFLLLLFLGLALTNCQLEEEPLKHENQINTLNYKNDILSYLKNLRKNSNKELSAKIEELATSFDHSSLKIYDLKSSQKIIIADIRSLTGLEDSNKIKIIFFLNENKIVRSRIVTFNNKTLFDDYDKVILSILDRNKNQALYSGKIYFYSLTQNILLSNEFDNGKLTINGILSIKNNKSKTAKANGCIDWYWVTTYQDGSQTSEYLYTTCDSCEEMANKLLTTNSCGGGGSGGGTGSGPNFPFSPNINQIYDYFSPEGEHIRYQFINNIWKIILISLPDIVVKSVPESRPYLVFDWPQDQQKVYGEGFVFTYEYRSGSWVGVPATDQLIAEVIEDQIDDSKLDPCSKGVLDKIKNTTVCDFADLLAKLGVDGSIYKTVMKTEHNNDNYGNPITSPANTVRTPGIKYEYTVYINPDYNDKTKLYTSTLLLHEIAHTYFFSLVDDYNAGATNSFNELPILFNAAVSKKYPINPELHHEEIANSYVNAIASALKEFQPNLPQQVYEDLAWAGLMDTDIFKIRYPEGSTSWQRIRNRIAAEQSGRSVSDGGINQDNYGQPCK
jgi:hypothetical protein